MTNSELVNLFDVKDDTQKKELLEAITEGFNGFEMPKFEQEQDEISSS